MNLNDYFAPLIRWWWLLVLATIVAGASSYYVTSQQPPLYQSRTTLMIGQSISSPNPSSNQFYLGEQLAAIYADMATREPVRRATMEVLGLTWLPEYVARVVPDSQMVEITVSDTNPIRAQAVAAELARQLIRRTPTNANPENQDRQQFIEQQLDQLQTDIADTQKQIENLKFQLGSITSAREIAETERQITMLETKLTSLNGNYSSLLASTDQGALNTLNVIEDAEVPTRPIAGNLITNVLLASLVGLALAGGTAYATEFLDPSVKSRREAERALNAPALAEVPQVKESEEQLTYVLADPYSPFADAFRTLRVNLDVAGLGTTFKTILITSPGVADGKTTVSSNLLLTMAEGKRNVVLVDADIYRSPFEERAAASGYKLGEGSSLEIEEHGLRIPMVSLRRKLAALAPGAGPNVTATDMLVSPEVGLLMKQLREIYDVVIIDSPPFILSDAMLLATQADAVLVVVKQGTTRRDTLHRMHEYFTRSNIKVLGFVLNNATVQAHSQYQYYYQNAKGSHRSKKAAAKDKDSKGGISNLPGKAL